MVFHRVQFESRVERETHFPTPQPPSQARPWFHGAHEHEERSSRPCRTPQKGPETADRLVRAESGRWFTSLRRSGEIAFVRKRGRSAGTPTLVGYALPRSSGPSQICVSVSKSVGGATVRNLVRRRVRGVLEALAAPPESIRVLFVAKPLAATVGYDRLAADVELVVRRLTPVP